MTRYMFGAGGDGEINSAVTGLPYANTVANVYNARTSGSAVTDLQNLAGGAITQVTSDAYGQFAFFGPDNYKDTLWIDLGTGPRWAMRPVDINGLMTSTAAATAASTIASTRSSDYNARTFTQKAGLPHNPNDPLLETLVANLDGLVVAKATSGADQTARFPSPANGDHVYRTDLQQEFYYNSTLAAWLPYTQGAWFSYSPTWGVLSGTAPVLGNGTIVTRYVQLGKTVTWTGKLTMGTTTNGGTGIWYMTWPVAPNSTLPHRGIAEYFRPGVNNWIGECIVDSANPGIVFIVKDNTSSQSFANVSNTAPTAAASTNQVLWTITYEAA